MTRVSSENTSPLNLPSMRTVPSNVSLPSNCAPRPRSVVISPAACGRAAACTIGEHYHWIWPTHEAMSKNMNASAFSCGVSAAVDQPPGYAAAGFDDDPDATCMSENTTLPQRAVGSTSFGVVNWKFCGIFWAPLFQ